MSNYNLFLRLHNILIYKERVQNEENVQNHLADNDNNNKVRPSLLEGLPNKYSLQERIACMLPRIIAVLEKSPTIFASPVLNKSHPILNNN